MQESKLLGMLVPPSPHILPIVHARGKKCQLPEISPDDGPIDEIFLNGQLAPLEDFPEDKQFLVQSAPTQLPPLLA